MCGKQYDMTLIVKEKCGHMFEQRKYYSKFHGATKVTEEHVEHIQTKPSVLKARILQEAQLVLG